MAIQVSEKAIQAIKTASAKRATPAKGLRVGIRGGGCTGFSYLFEWSDVDARPEDRVLSYENGQVNVFHRSQELHVSRRVDARLCQHADGQRVQVGQSQRQVDLQLWRKRSVLVRP
jgi:Fe-S cluster assembly iron-binding protein IscA